MHTQTRVALKFGAMTAQRTGMLIRPDTQASFT
jgi:hypothetical protein